MNRNSKRNDYDKYLSTIHQKLSTPEEIIRDAVKEGTGLGLLSKERIIAGEVNEVYDITLVNNKHVILRISQEGKPNFQQEKWAISQCKKAGVPIPEIIFIKYVSVENKQRSLCLMEKMEGKPLERGGINFDKLNLETKKDLIRQAGEILSRIHSIATTGFGWIIGEGKAEYSTFQELVQEKAARQGKFEEIAAGEGLNKSIIPRAFKVIGQFTEAYSKQIPKLNHGDYSHKHFMVTGNKIVGILDWGSVRSDSPIYDFSTWDYWFGDYIPTDWLKNGYQNKSLFDSNFNDFLHMLRIFNGLDIFEWYHQKHQQNMDKAKENLLKDLEHFS